MTSQEVVEILQKEDPSEKELKELMNHHALLVNNAIMMDSYIGHQAFKRVEPLIREGKYDEAIKALDEFYDIKKITIFPMEEKGLTMGMVFTHYIAIMNAINQTRNQEIAEAKEEPEGPKIHRINPIEEIHRINPIEVIKR